MDDALNKISKFVVNIEIIVNNFYLNCYCFRLLYIEFGKFNFAVIFLSGMILNAVLMETCGKIKKKLFLSKSFD